MGGPRSPDTPGGVAMGCPQGEDGVATLARDPRAVAMGCPQSGDGGTTVPRSPQSHGHGVSPAVPKVRIRGPWCPDTPGGVVVGWPLCAPKVRMGGPRCPDPHRATAMGCPQGGDGGTTVHRPLWRGGHGVSQGWGWGDHGAQGSLKQRPWGVPKVRMGWPQCPDTPGGVAVGCLHLSPGWG